MTDDPAEATGFAHGLHLSGSGSEPQIHRLKMRPGRVRNIDPEIDDAMAEGEFGPDTIDQIIAAERGKPSGARYLQYTHPSNVHGGEFTAMIALHPHGDLLHHGSIRLLR